MTRHSSTLDELFLLLKGSFAGRFAPLPFKGPHNPAIDRIKSTGGGGDFQFQAIGWCVSNRRSRRQHKLSATKPVINSNHALAFSTDAMLDSTFISPFPSLSFSSLCPLEKKKKKRPFLCLVYHHVCACFVVRVSTAKCTSLSLAPLYRPPPPLSPLQHFYHSLVSRRSPLPHPHPLRCLLCLRRISMSM